MSRHWNDLPSHLVSSDRERETEREIYGGGGGGIGGSLREGGADGGRELALLSDDGGEYREFPEDSISAQEDTKLAFGDGIGSQGIVHGSNSGPPSDEDPAAVDERKQKRMLSNRESARRSRLRKQQHLDELRGQVAQLRTENSDMLNRYNIASRHYTQLTEENRALRSHAMDLSRRLQRLHHQAAAQGQPVGPDYGMSHSHMDPMSLGMGPPMGSMPHHMAPHPHAMSLSPHVYDHGHHPHAHMAGHPPPSSFHPSYSRSLTPEVSR